jgi:hypothetical protein
VGTFSVVAEMMGESHLLTCVKAGLRDATQPAMAGRAHTTKHCYSLKGRWLMPVILAIQKAEIRRLKVQSLSQANSSQGPNWKKKKNHKKGLMEWFKQ